MARPGRAKRGGVDKQCSAIHRHGQCNARTRTAWIRVGKARRGKARRAARQSLAEQRSAQALRRLAAQGRCDAWLRMGNASAAWRGQSLVRQRQAEVPAWHCLTEQRAARATRPMAKHGGGGAWFGQALARQCLVWRGRGTAVRRDGVAKRCQPAGRGHSSALRGAGKAGQRAATFRAGGAAHS